MTTFQIWKPVVVLAVLVISLFAVYPSIMWYSLPVEDRIENQSTPEMREIEAEIETLKEEERLDEIPSLQDRYESLNKRFEKLRRRSIPLGLDLQGGIHAVLEVDTQDLPKNRKVEAVQRSREILQNRIDQLGVLEPLLQRQGENRIIVEIPGITDPTRIIDLLGKTARLEFKLVKDAAEAEQVVRRIDEKLGVGILDKVAMSTDGEDLEVLEEDQKYVDQVISKEGARSALPAGYELVWSRPEESNEKGTIYLLYLLKATPDITGENLKDARLQVDTAKFNEPYVILELDRRGATIFRRVTGENIGKRLAIVLDSRVYSAPVIRERIPSGTARITGRFTMEEARDLAIVLSAGALPADINIVETRAVGPSLGMDSIVQGVKAAVGGALVVVIFMILYYLVCGLIADFALILNLVILLGTMALFKATLTLPGIAGMILIIGMSVDANVLIYERIREELRIRRERALGISIEKGYSRAFVTILDANLTTLLTAVVLFTFGTGPIRGFAVTLSLGIIISMFTAIFVTRIIFDFMTNQMNAKQVSIGVYQIFKDTKIDFMKWRKYALLASLAVIVVGLVSVIVQGGLKTNIDFAGGTLLQVRFQKPLETQDVRAGLTQAGFGGADLQRVIGEQSEFIIRVKEGSITPAGRNLVRAEFEQTMKKVFADSPPDIKLVTGIEQLEDVSDTQFRDEYKLTFDSPISVQDMVTSLADTSLARADIVQTPEENNAVIIRISQGESPQLLAALSQNIPDNPFELRRQEKVGSRIGSELKGKAFKAALFSIIGILLYIGWRFQFGFAVGAVIALLHDVLVTLGIFSLMGKEMSLTVVAAILTLIGYSLNDTIVVYDRIRENRGLLGGPRDWPSVINTSINQTLGRTFLTSVTTFLVVISLYLFGGIVIHDFAFALLVGIIAGTYSSVYIASPILIYWQHKKQ